MMFLGIAFRASHLVSRWIPILGGYPNHFDSSHLLVAANWRSYSRVVPGDFHVVSRWIPSLWGYPSPTPPFPPWRQQTGSGITVWSWCFQRGFEVDSNCPRVSQSINNHFLHRQQKTERGVPEWFLVFLTRLVDEFRPSEVNSFLFNQFSQWRQQIGNVVPKCFSRCFTMMLTLRDYPIQLQTIPASDWSWTYGSSHWNFIANLYTNRYIIALGFVPAILYFTFPFWSYSIVGSPVWMLNP